ncbi:ribosomal protein S18-alanine N-acetyltransferase [Uliginosibacterium sp. H1]|uniref:ribosomal protein S18-alanine N-acetyltransferase n=1 Tax=Uliginosibacterium sp. H1 TaxID=3114757 RepID=UPI002E178FCE|nr:ribosomal protein S18-alanine N-acetyltransferase [Uliginosibacterium sp. H1]
MSGAAVNAACVCAPMQEDDLDWVVRLEHHLHASPWSRGHFVDSLQAGYSCWVLHSDGERVGYAVMMAVLDEAHLLNICVDQARQRQGWGAHLLAHLCQVARRAGATQMFLEVRPSNLPAQALYARSGFAQIARRKAYYPGHAGVGGREDALVLRRDLTSLEMAP